MKIYMLAALLISATSAHSQFRHLSFKGMYFQWGYNTEAYTRSNIHFKMSNGNDFTLHNARGNDKPDMSAILEKPFEVSIPQYNYRIGFYLNKKHTRSIELNFDHAKYVLSEGQTVHVTGIIDGVQVDGDSVINAENFLHLEHTDGANWLHLNYVQQKTILVTKKTARPLVNLIWKVGAGINIPRTDFTWKAVRLNNKFHISGYNISAEAGARLYATNKLFFELTGKSGYVKYVNALTNYGKSEGNRVKHGFGYIELIGTIGYDINF